MKKSTGNLIAGVLLILSALIYLWRTDFDNIDYSRLGFSFIFLVAAFFNFFEYPKNKAKEQNEEV